MSCDLRGFHKEVKGAKKEFRMSKVVFAHVIIFPRNEGNCFVFVKILYSTPFQNSVVCPEPDTRTDRDRQMKDNIVIS